MNITEANAVAALVHLLDGTSRTTDPDKLLEQVEVLADRAGRPLQVHINVDLAEARSTLVHLVQRAADADLDAFDFAADFDADRMAQEVTC